MEELSLDDVIRGLSTKDYVEHHVTLLQHLTNITSQPDVSADEARLSKALSNICIIMHYFSQTGGADGRGVSLLTISLMNLTATENAAANCTTLLAEESSSASKAFKIALNGYFDYNPRLESDETSPDWEVIDPYQYVGSVLCNLCQVEAGRRIILKKSDEYVPKLALQVLGTWNNTLITLTFPQY